MTRQLDIVIGNCFDSIGPSLKGETIEDPVGVEVPGTFPPYSAVLAATFQ